MAMEIVQDPTLHFVSLGKRCVKCPDTTPSCPECAKDEICSQTSLTCSQCPSRQCVNKDQSGVSQTASNSGSGGGGGTNIGAIAGGVVGGVVFMVIVAFIIWKFFLKGKRHEIVEEDYEFHQQRSPQMEKSPNPEFGMHRSARASTHTVQSMASTVLTRASNIIQIAYIPGVTNRSTASPGLLVPPVPPIPSLSSASSPYRDTVDVDGEQVFFTAGDIRDSTYSGMTTYTDNRTSITPSLARSSVATTIFRGQAQVSPVVPSHTMIRGKAAVVSVKGGSRDNSALNTPTIESAPPVPQIDFSRHGSASAAAAGGPRTIQVRMPSSTDGLSPANSVRTVTIGAKPTALNIVKRPGMPGKQGSRDAVPVTTSIADAISKAAAGGSVAAPTTAKAASTTSSNSSAKSSSNSGSGKSFGLDAISKAAAGVGGGDSPTLHNTSSPTLGLGLRQAASGGSLHQRAKHLDDNASLSSSNSDSSDDDGDARHEHARSRRSLLGRRKDTADSAGSGPFGDSNRATAAEEEEEAEATPMRKGKERARDGDAAFEYEQRVRRARSPFGDAHAVD